MAMCGTSPTARGKTCDLYEVLYMTYAFTTRGKTCDLHEVTPTTRGKIYNLHEATPTTRIRTCSR